MNLKMMNLIKMFHFYTFVYNLALFEQNMVLHFDYSK